MKTFAPLLFIAGAIAAYVYGKTKLAKEITLRLKSIKVLIKKITLTNLPVLVTITIDNPTDQEIDIKSVTSQLILNGNSFASAINNAPTTIRAKASTDLLLPVNINILNIGILIKPFLDAINKGIRPTIQTKTEIETTAGTLVINDQKTVDLIR